MNIVIIQPSTRPNKKFDATINGTKTISFGDKRFEDYTTHKDDVRQQRYIIRNRKNQNWDDPTTAGALSRWLLWNKKISTFICR